VLEKLNIRLQSPPLPNRPTSQGSTSDSNISTGIPRTIKQLKKRKSRLDSGLSLATDKISSPTKRDLQQYYNMTVKMLHSQILMKDEIKRLREANKKQVKKRARSRRQIAHEGILTEVLDIINPVSGERGGVGEYISCPAPAPEPQGEPTLPVLPPVRRQNTCSKCGGKGHRFTTCQQKV
jgi:hypothetical protein